MTDPEPKGIEERRRQLSAEERAAEAAYDKEAASTAPLSHAELPSQPVGRLKELQDVLMAARAARKAFNEEHPPESVVGH